MYFVSSVVYKFVQSFSQLYELLDAMLGKASLLEGCNLIGDPCDSHIGGRISVRGMSR